MDPLISPELHINHLPDVVLRIIFSKLSLVEQIWNLSVCTHWNAIQSQLFLTRNSFDILLDDDAASCITQ